MVVTELELDLNSRLIPNLQKSSEWRRGSIESSIKKNAAILKESSLTRQKGLQNNCSPDVMHALTYISGIYYWQKQTG